MCIASWSLLASPLSGRLSASVGGHPPFPGTEAGYLRARIAIISAGALAAPRGALAEPEPGAEHAALVAAEDWVGAGDGGDLASLE